MKAQIRRWINEEQRNELVEVEIIRFSGRHAIKLDGLILVDGFDTVESALQAAESLVKSRRLSNS